MEQDIEFDSDGEYDSQSGTFPSATESDAKFGAQSAYRLSSKATASSKEQLELARRLSVLLSPKQLVHVCRALRASRRASWNADAARTASDVIRRLLGGGAIALEGLLNHHLKGMDAELLEQVAVN